MNKKKQYIIQTIIGILLIFSLTLTAWLKAPAAMSAAERRPLKQFPELTQADFLSARWMSEFESYTIDQFPLRETFRSWKAYINTALFGQKLNNKVMSASGHLSEIDYPLNMDSLDHAASVIENIYETILETSDVKVYLSIIPDKNFYLAKEAPIPVYDYDRLFSYMKDRLNFAEYIDLTETLELNDYYKTDIHWRQEAISNTASLLLDAMNEKATLPQFSLKQHRRDFKGVYTGRYARAVSAEEISYIDSPTFDKLEVFDHENQKEISLYRHDVTQNADPYSFFLNGPLSLITIDNPEASGNRELVIFRDSFGSSIAPYFTSTSSRVTLVDIRYLPSELLPKFIDFENQDILFLYSSSILNKSSQLR